MVEKWVPVQHISDENKSLYSDQGTNMVIGTSSNTSALGSSQPSKLEHLPRLRRQERENATEESKKPSMSEKLNRMRIEDKRRIRNLEARQRSGNKVYRQNDFESSSSIRANAPSFRPNVSQNSTFSSASARAGTSYMAATHLSQQDSMEARRMNQLRRKFAGPVPPSSWTQNGNEEEQLAAIEDEPIVERKVNRSRALAASRLFFSRYENGRNAESSGDKDKEEKSIHSLTDITLISIIIALSENSPPSSKFEEKLLSLPVHLKERTLGLAGRYARTKSLGEAGLRALFGKNDGSLMEDTERFEEKDSFEESKEDDMLDSWDNESEQMEWDTTAKLSTIDLSFACISARSLRDLILSPSIEANHIRALSLAGWGYGEDASQSSTGRMRKCLRTSTTLINMLDQMTNLEMLSLASTKLLPGIEDWYIAKKVEVKDGSTEKICTGLSPEIASEALAFLKKLARRTSNLQTLDLSSCHWINGAVLSNIGFYSTNIPIRRLIWPKLQNLVLTDCPAFNDKMQVNDDIRPKPNQGTFTGQWHAAHHGIVRFTNSPYFLSHKPGLGRSVLAHGIGAWDSVNSNRNTQSLVGREAIALARHNGHVQRSRQLEAARRGGRQGLENERLRSAFDDDESMIVQSDGSGAFGIFTGFAISHGVAPFSGRQAGNSSSATTSSWSTPPRCPVSGKKVADYEWERARVLDAIHGRWGSAIVGTLEDELENSDGTISHNSSRGEFITVYF